jgi:benzoyl-CoA reductase subunit B
MIKNEPRWETRPLDCWNLAKELRRKFDRNIGDTNYVMGNGMSSFTMDWASAFPAIKIVEDNPVGSMMAAQDEPFARKARLASEVRGWGREICGYHNNCWGAQFLGHTSDGKPFPKRQFTVPFPCVCDSHIKRGQQCRDFEAIPRWANDFTMYIGDYDPVREEAMLDHRNFNTLKMLNEMETVFGQKLDDEKLFEMAGKNRQAAQYRRDITYFMTFTPAPLTVKELYSFFQLNEGKLTAEENLHFWKTLRDEVEWRVQNKIAAVANERFRWIEAHPPPWHFLKYYRYMERYGAVCLGSQYSNLQDIVTYPEGGYHLREYGYDTSYPPDTLLTTREDAVRYMTSPEARNPQHWKIEEYMRPNVLNDIIKTYNADGALFGLWRAGVGCTLLRKEQAMSLRDDGYSVLLYEGSQPGDRIDLDEKRFLEQIDTWMESLGFELLD